MRVAYRKFIRCIPAVSLLLVFVVAHGETVLPAGQAMEPLIGVPYKLFARQPETETFRALNCFTSVMYALRRIGYNCPNMSFNQGLAYWWPKAKALRLGETHVSGKGGLLLTRKHFLLLHTDWNDDGLIDGDDLVIHAYYRPAEISTFADWMKESPGSEIRYLPLDESFVCPSAREVTRFRRQNGWN